MQATVLTWYLIALGTVAAELQCEWEHKEKSYLSGWAPGIPARTKYDTLEEAQKVCKTLGDNCGGITYWSGGYTCREGKEFVAHSSEESWRKSCMGVPLFRVSSITPNKGSRVGGSRITISGQGFSTNQFGYDDPSLGNKVTFYHKDEEHPAVQCVVQTYYTSSTRIVCDLAKPDVYWGDWLEYRIRISVDGTWMDSTGTNIYCGGACTYWFHKDNTPYISSVGSAHVPAGSVLTMTGRMWTDNFEPSTDVSSDSDHIKRVFLNSFTCDPSDENGNSYGTDLEVDENGEDTSVGSIKCKSKSPGATSYRTSFLHSKWGRSEVRANVNKVDSQMQKYSIQTYNELKTVSPTEGSKNGGTKITITSEHVVGPESNIKVDVGGNDCKVESYTTDKIVCSTPASQEKTVYPGNRGVTVEYWSKETDKSTNDARGLDVDLIRAFTQDADNFLFQKLHLDSKPDTLKTITGQDKDEPYYVRLKFFLNIQETDQYGFHMVTEHSGKLYVSTDDDPANVVLRANCTSRHDNWNKLQTDVDITLEAGKIYYVEFVGVMWNYGQYFGVGMTKKTTPYQTYDVDTSRKEYPYWYWKQDYSDEIQVIDLGGLIKTPATGFKLQIGDRETTTLYASSTAEQISDAIIDTAVYKCPTLDAADSWYSVDFENGDMSYTGGWSRNTIEPYCGRWVAVNTWAVFHVKYEKQVYEWDLSKGYKHLCFALMTAQPRVSLYYELDYEDSNFRWQRQGFWRGADETPELQDNDGTWKYNCIDFEKRVKEIDNSLWENRIGNRKWKIRRVLLGVDTGKYGDYYTDSLRIVRTALTENSRVKGFALDGPGLLEAATIEITDYCDDGEDCTNERTEEAVSRKWKINMKTYGCGYNFPLIGIVGKTATVVTKNTETKYTVGGKTVNIKREAAITPDLQGTFDLTIDGHKYEKIDVHIKGSEFLTLVRNNGDYSQAHKWGNCYERHWRLERRYSGHHGWHSIDSTNVVGVGEVRTYVMYRDNERGGLVMTPLYGDWLRTAHSKPQVAVKVGGIQAFCNGTCDYTASDAQTPTATSLTPSSGGSGTAITITGTGFGTTRSAVTVTLGGVAQTVTTVTDTAVTIALTDAVAKAHPAEDIVVYVAGKGNAKVTDGVTLTYTGSASAISPTTGSVGGGTVVTITGSGFDPNNAGVTFSGNAGQVTSATYKEIKVIAPAGTAGVAPIVITGGAGFVAPNSASLVYTYSATGVPTVSQISPGSGSVVGNTKVTITGTNLADIKEAKIGDVVCAKNAEETSTDTTYYCITGPNSPERHLVTMVTNSGELAQSTTKFYHKLLVQDVTPLQGSVVGGTEVTITGSGFGTDKTKLNVELGDLECAVTSVTDTLIKCRTEAAYNVDQLWTEYVSAPTCVESKPTGYKKTAQEVHNMYRRRHKDTPDICYSSEVAKTADYWANYMVEKNVFKSSSSSNREGRGENLMMFEHWDLKSDEAYMRDAITAWYSEGSKFDADQPSNALRYSQMLWSLSDKVGCSIAKSTRTSTTEKYRIYVVCHYAPAGNTEGKFDTYVKTFDTAHHRTTAALTSRSVAVNVFLDTRKATVNKVASTSSDECAPLTGSVSGCSDSAPAAASGDFSYAYFSCSTPRITNVTRQLFWDETIRIDGKGFGTNPCAVKVKLGSEHECTVTAVSDQRISCKVDLTSEPPVFTLFEAKVTILGRGDAVFSGENHEHYAYSSIQPKITSISPNQGSLKGGLSVVLTGGGFKYNTGEDAAPISGSVSDGVTDFEILSATYKTITVRSRTGVPDETDTPKDLTLTQDGASVECGSCTYTYKLGKTPTVTNVTKTAKDPGPGFTVIITGTLLCPGQTGTTISIGGSTCIPISDGCTNTEVTCEVGDMPSGTYDVSISTANGYPKYDDGMNKLNFEYAITSVQPTSGSVHGGTVITITGTGLPATDTLSVTTSKYTLTVVSMTTSQIIARTPDRKITDGQSNQIRFNGAYINHMYQYETAKSPIISDISPASGTYDTELTITGERFLNQDNETSKTSVVVGEDKSCVISSVTLTEIKCKLPHAAAGEYSVVVKVDPYGDSNLDKKIDYTMNLGATDPASPTTGTLGGPTVALQGSGFPHGEEDASLNVTVCGVEVEAELVSTSLLNIPLPPCPSSVCTTDSHSCDIVVRRFNTTMTKTGAVTYNKGDTPSITNIDPADAGTGGGKTITITGTGFSDVTSDVTVTFDGVTCTVVTTSTTQITCKTGAKADKANKDGVEVRIKKSLALNPDKKTMTYMDKWSSKFTWGGDLANKPAEGDLAVLTEGQIIYLDESPPKLRALLLRGGHLVFDDNQDLILKADYILVLGGGSITIGTEENPFQHEAIIEMYGNQQSTELPMYGAKTLAVRNGTVEMHGKEVTPKWTELGETAEAGATSIVINTETNWKVSDQIALSSSSFAPEENEEFLITSITYNSESGKTTIGLNNPLKYRHISLEQTINGLKIKTAAKVGHLTRNVKMRGNVNEDHLEMVDACPQTFDPDQFATQTCYQGRYGAMMDSDQFGSQIMFHAAAMETREVHGRLENAEFSWAGQAFRLGRYPIHFHMNGDVSGSYVKGCAIHHTFNRAVTVHGVNNLLVKDNVAFNNLGHAFFLEDGVEEDNVFDGNLAIFTQSSSSLLNVDVTPASFWIVNPRNTFINNVAAGSTHFGFWFNMPEHPGGPSATNTICPRNMGMKEFRGNEAHSCGRYGIWVWEFWNPRGNGSCEATTPNMTTLHDFHGWHNLRGVEVEDGTGIAMDNFVLHDNWFSQMEVHKCRGATFEEGNTRMTNSQIISKTKSSDGLKLLYTDEEFQCGTGVVIPGKGTFSVHDSTMHDFTQCPVFQACGGCKDRQGGFPNEFKGIKYINSPIRGKFQWEFEVILRDLDGSLSETGKANSIITPNMAILDKTSCSKSDAWSHGEVEGAVCDDKTNLVRLGWNDPSIKELLFKSVFLTNSHGNVSVPWFFKRMTHGQGWMATVPTGNTYSMKWDTELKFTNASYKMTAYYPKDGDYIILEQNLNDKPDYITVGGSSNKKLEAIDGTTDDPGTFTFDDDTKKLSHLITGKGIETTKELPMDLKVYKCFYENCTDPHPKPLPSNPTLLQRPETPKRWSVSSDWMGTKQGLGGYNGILPKAGDDVEIPSSWWMIYDASMEGLNNITVYGVLEFSNEVDTLLGANRIVVIGGKLVVGWADEPLKVKAHIKLTGSREDKEYSLNDGTTIGSKAIGIAGFTEMHSVVPDVLATTLSAKASKGDSKITVKDNVADKWKVGDEIAIASTSFVPDQAEKRTITKVEGHVLTLDQALEFDHDYLLQTINEHTYERTAEVGLLTRLITIEGVMDPADTTLYGGRVLVSDYSQINAEGEREEYIPVAQIMGVQFKNCGQRGYRDYWDPRYALALQNTKPGEDSYVKSCAVDVSHNHAIGIIGSHNVEVSGNVVYHSRGSGILSNSENTEIVGNTIIYVRSYANWETPVENDNYFMDACIETWETKTASLKDNRCGGSERAGFSTQGEELSGTFWQNNVAHSCLWGIFVRKSKHDVVKLNKMTLWQNYDFGVAHFSTSSLVVQDCVLADNGRSIFNMVVGPNPLDHTLTNKYVEYKNTLIYGRRDDSSCDERKTDVNPTSKLDGIGYHPPVAGKGGRVGMFLSNFIGGFPGWPKFPITSPMTYSSIKGITTINGLTIANFGRCNDVVISDLRSNGDCFHPVKMSGMTYSGVDMESNLLHMNNPVLGFVNSADCVDMPCDAKKKILITDLDGTTLGKAGDTLTSRSEFQWDSGDQRWGMGDYRIPNQMTTLLNGSFVKPSNWPNKGIDRVLNGDTKCEYKENYNMYKCSGVTYKMLVIESMDGDTELRRLSPLALATDDGSVDLINGPMDHGWCGGYTCQQRISTFYALVIVGKEYKLYLTSTQPQSMRYMLIDAAAGDKIKLDIWYSKSQRLDVYYKGKYKAPTNAQKKADGSYSYATDKTAEELYPKLSSAAGTNFFDSKAHWMSMIIQGSDPFTIKTSPKIVLSLTLESVDGSNFFDEDKIIDNLAALLGVPKEKIKIAKIVAEGRRKRSGQEFQIEISEPAIEDEASMDVTKVTEMATALTKASETFVETVQKGELGKVLEAEVKSVSVQLPEIPPADQRNITVDQEEASKTTGETYAEKMAKEEANKAENAESIAVLIPNSLKLVDASNKVAVLSNIALRSKVVTSDDRIVPLLGAGEKKWRASVELLEGPKNGRILGTKQVTFANGYGNLTDIRVSRKGQYKFKVAVTYPEKLGHEIGDISVEITDQEKDSPYKRVVLKFDGDYDEIVGNKSAEFTTYMKSLLKKRFPNYQFDDIDHYKGSVTVETTVSTDKTTKEDTEAAVSKMAEDTKEDFSIEFNGRTARMAEFSGDAEGSGGSNAAAIVVPIVIVVLLAGLAAGGFIYYKKKQNRVSESIHMSKVKNVDSDPTLTRPKEGSNIYSNHAVNVDVACESGQQGQVANEPLAKIAAIHKALQALNRLESAVNDPRYNPMVEDELDEICVDSRPGTADTRPGTGDRDSRAGLAVPASEDQSSRDGLIDPDTPGTSDSEGNWRERHNTVTECVSCKEVKKTWPCPICSGPRYCSKPCLDKDWPEHHVHCRSRSRNAQRDASDDQSFC